MAAVPHTPRMNDTPPPSPCTGVCAIDPASALCRGCARTLDEIEDWFTATAARKRAILAVVEQRQKLSVRSK